MAYSSSWIDIDEEFEVAFSSGYPFYSPLPFTIFSYGIWSWLGSSALASCYGWVPYVFKLGAMLWILEILLSSLTLFKFIDVANFKFHPIKYISLESSQSKIILNLDKSL